MLVTGDDETRARMDRQVGLAEAIAEQGGRLPVGGDAEDAAVVFTDGRRFLATFADDELAFRGEADRAGEFAHVGGLGEGVREELMDVGFTVAVRIAESPDAIAVEDVNLFVADGAGHRLVQSRSETAPGDVGGALLESAGQPDIAIQGDDDRGAVLEELNVAGADGALPWVVDGEGDVVDDVGVLGGTEGDLGRDRGFPSA